MKTIESVELFFQEGTSDKVYNAAILEEGPGSYTVSVEWGRRGTPLNKGSKAVKVGLEKAKREFEKVVREKTHKGYQPITKDVKPAAVAPPVGQGSASRVASTGRARTGQAAQLLNAIEEPQVEALILDETVVAQQKLDGVRILAHVKTTGVIATNRAGQVTEIPEAVVAAIAEAPEGSVLDGELVGGEYWLFDLLQHGTEDLRPLGYRDRYAELDALAGELAGPVKLVPSAWTKAEKKALFERLRKAKAEGIVFKRGDAAYKPGRPASGGAQLKYKFVKTADVFLTANAGNAYQMAVYAGKKVREIGKVFAGTTNEVRKELDRRISEGERPVAEVQYLYATDDDNLFQPVFLQLRDDKEPEECTLEQLVHTNREIEAQVERRGPKESPSRKRG
jgi:bifunctional non-homologous end joining protein LigD